LRAMADRMVSFRPKTSQTLPQQRSVIESVSQRLDDLIAFA